MTTLGIVSITRPQENGTKAAADELDSNSEGRTAGIVIGCVLGGLALAAVVVIIYVVNRRSANRWVIA